MRGHQDPVSAGIAESDVSGARHRDLILAQPSSGGDCPCAVMRSTASVYLEGERTKGQNMEQPRQLNVALGALKLPDVICRWVMGPSVEAEEVREQVALVVRFFGDLDAAIECLGPDDQVYQLAQQVRAAMIQNLLADAAKRLADRGDVVRTHPVGPSPNQIAGPQTATAGQTRQ
jgi:hypothetical protein